MRYDIKGSKTEKNLETAFCRRINGGGISIHTFKSKRRKICYVQIAIFLKQETANNEKEQHAKMWFKLLNDLRYRLHRRMSAGSSGSYENYEWTDMYHQGNKEGFTEIARLFEGVAKVEKSMRMMRKAFLQNVKEYGISRPMMWFGSVPTGWRHCIGKESSLKSAPECTSPGILPGES